jgi:stage II sporulation protein D
MRRSLILFVVAALALAVAPSAPAGPVFFVDGRGWGHGIGMAQYGAQGFASKENRSHEWILEHYYRGTTLGPTSVETVRVLLADGRRSLAIGSEAAFTARDANGRTYRFPAGRLDLGPGLRVTVGGETRTLASPVTFARGTRFLELGGRPYRGQLVVRSSGKALSAVNHVGLEAYLYGVVPDEMPPSWASEALKAQAVAARSYAVVSRRTGGIFDLYADTRSQVYGGVPSEDARTNAAIDATAGRVVLYDGKVAWTFFHSTSGGRTAAIHHVWNAAPIPYLVSVPDPHDTLSPYHTWGPFRYTARRLRAKLGSVAPPGAIRDATTATNPSQRVDTVAVRGARGISRISGTTFQSRLGLRSSWFSIAVLSLSGPPRVTWGEEARLSGLARGVTTASLERRAWGGSWERVGPLDRSGGTFAVAVTPTVTTSYRVSSPKGKGQAHRVAVAPLVRLADGGDGKTLRGAVRPRLADAPVTIQRLTSRGWTTVARTRTNARGGFRATVNLVPGSYRAAVTPGSGYVTGFSAHLRLGA